MKVLIFANVMTGFVVALIGFDGGQTAPSDREAQEVTAARQQIESARQGVLNSAHDFTDVTGRPGDACSACHVPHVQQVRPTSDPGADAALELYKMGGQREVFVPDRFMPGPTSLICLSCHNGTVADSTIGTSHALLAGQREGFDLPDSFVWRDHPIGVEYPAVDKNYRSKAVLQKQGKVLLPEGRVECVSCHDPHNASGEAMMLVMSNRRSALCLACHNK